MVNRERKTKVTKNMQLFVMTNCIGKKQVVSGTCNVKDKNRDSMTAPLNYNRLIILKRLQKKTGRHIGALPNIGKFTILCHEWHI